MSIQTVSSGFFSGGGYKHTSDWADVSKNIKDSLPFSPSNEKLHLCCWGYSFLVSEICFLVITEKRVVSGRKNVTKWVIEQNLFSNITGIETDVRGITKIINILSSGNKTTLFGEFWFKANDEFKTFVFKKLNEIWDLPKQNTQNIDLAQLHEYLTKGIITQEEFDAKKKQILGL